MIESLLEYLSSNPPGIWAGPMLGLIAFGETLFPPIPGDVLFIVISGWAIAGGLHILPVVLFGATGCILASFFLFFVGHRPGRKLIDKWLEKRVEAERIDKARRLVSRHGPLILAGSRFIPGIRSLLVLVAGTSGMRFVCAVLPVVFSAGAWYTILACAGSILGSKLDAAKGFMHQFELWIWIVMAAVVIAVILARLMRRNRSR